jgi:hypothetical protein
MPDALNRSSAEVRAPGIPTSILRPTTADSTERPARAGCDPRLRRAGSRVTGRPTFHVKHLERGTSAPDRDPIGQLARRVAMALPRDAFPIADTRGAGEPPARKREALGGPRSIQLRTRTLHPTGPGRFT